jgi:tetratricopeptide (TPR) repeat protein
MDPENTDLYLEFGNLLLGAGIWREALEIYQEGMKHNPKNPEEFHESIGSIYMLIEDIYGKKFAYPEFKKACEIRLEKEIDPEKIIELHFDIAFYSLDPQEKIGQYEFIRKNFPEYTRRTICPTMGAYLEMKNYHKVIEEWNRYKEILTEGEFKEGSSYFYAYNTYIQAQYRLGNWEEAVKGFEKILKKDPDCKYYIQRLKIQKLIADCLQKLKRYDEAIFYYQGVIDSLNQKLKYRKEELKEAIKEYEDYGGKYAIKIIRYREDEVNKVNKEIEQVQKQIEEIKRMQKEKER